MVVIREWGPLPMGSGPFFILKFFLGSKEKRCILPGRIVRVRRANVTHEMNCPTVLAYHSTPLLSAALTPPLTRGGLTPEPSRAAGEVGMSFIGRSPVCMFSLGPKGRLCGFMRRTGFYLSVYIPHHTHCRISGNTFPTAPIAPKSSPTTPIQKPLHYKISNKKWRSVISGRPFSRRTIHIYSLIFTFPFTGFPSRKFLIFPKALDTASSRAKEVFSALWAEPVTFGYFNIS